MSQPSSSRNESPESDTANVRDVPSLLDKTGPLLSSYTYHSPTPTAAGPYILGVDEAGRGPVLGPLVYGVAYCPVAYREQLNELGFAGTLILAKNRTLPLHFAPCYRLQNTDVWYPCFITEHSEWRCCKSWVVCESAEVSFTPLIRYDT